MPNENAISILKEDHRKVRKLLSALEETTERASHKRPELLNDLAAEIRSHSEIEEQIFYPAFKEAVEQSKDTKLFYEALEEHHVVDLLLPEILETDAASPEFGAKVKVLKELIEHHAQEEEDEMFVRAEELMDEEDLERLGARMLQLRTELLSIEQRLR